MTVYIITYVFIIIVAYFAKHVKGNKEKKRLIQVILTYGLLMALIAFRHPSMGVDLGYYRGYGYLKSFQNIATYSWKDMFSLQSYLNYEIGYVWFNKIVSVLGYEYQIIIIACALVSIVPIAMVIYKYSKDILLSTVIYISLPCFFILYSGLRQGIAVALCFFSMQYIEQKQLRKFIVLVLIASLFHSTSLVFLCAYSVYHIQLNKKQRWISVGILGLVFLFRYQLFSILIQILGRNASPDSNGAFMLLMIFVLIYCFCIVYEKEDRRLKGYMNIFYLACICQCFGGVYSIAIRVGYYFMIVLSLLLPILISRIKDYTSYTLTRIMVYICFVGFGLFSFVSTDWACANPYIWFWENVGM